MFTFSKVQIIVSKLAAVPLVSFDMNKKKYPKVLRRRKEGKQLVGCPKVQIVFVRLAVAPLVC